MTETRCEHSVALEESVSNSLFFCLKNVIILKVIFKTKRTENSTCLQVPFTWHSRCTSATNTPGDVEQGRCLVRQLPTSYSFSSRQQERQCELAGIVHPCNLRRQRHEDYKFEASLGYEARFYLSACLSVYLSTHPSIHK